MVQPNAEFAFSAEIECLTAVPDDPATAEIAAARFLQVLSQQTPSLPATQGVFTPYGKLYVDVGHVEIALAECDDPYLLPSLFERVQVLAGRVLDQLDNEGIRLILANNNHSGLLSDGCPVWGDHENYLVEQHPQTFTEQILPFLVTRLYHGAGGIHYPTGSYFAAVRPICMELASGGGTTENRAFHSTAREEHHMGANPKRFRYHQILGDGHRSQFNLALQFGATALAIKAVLFCPKLRAELKRRRPEFGESWVATLKRLNILSTPSRTLSIDSLVIRTQRLYLDGARRYADLLPVVPAWISRVLRDWQETLDAFERLDRPWLAARLDTFAKYEFFSGVLEQAGHTWTDLAVGKKQLLCEMALLDHSYHEFCNPKSVFARLESGGLMRHRVREQVLPGEEPQPYVPETKTRAQVRAQFICEHRGRAEFSVDWSWIHDQRRQVRCQLDDPFARELGAWQPCSRTTGRRLTHPIRSRLRGALEGVLSAYDQGQYQLADVRLREAVRYFQMVGRRVPTEALRYRAWLQGRLGFTDGPQLISDLYGRDTHNLLATNDFCCVYRFRGLVPDLQPMQPWIERGQEFIDYGNYDGHSETATVFRDHVAYSMLRHGHVDGALEVLQPSIATQSLSRMSPRLRGRIFSTAGEAYRLIGNHRRAGRYLKQAAQVQLEHGFLGLLADFTYASLAKWERTRRRALPWLAKAIEIQTTHRHRLGMANSLLLEARLCNERSRSDTARDQLLALHQALPALADCPLVNRILEYWDAWVDHDQLNEDDPVFWGL